MSDGSPIVTLRLPSSLKHWFDRYTESTGHRRTDVIRDLLVALRERRVFVTSEPAPNFINDGSDSENPISICPDPH